MPVTEVCRKVGIGVATFYNWRNHYTSLPPSKMKCLRQLEGANNRPKKIVADLSLDKAMLQEGPSKALNPALRLELVGKVRWTWKVSVRSVCSVLWIDRSLQTYWSKCGDLADLKKCITEICETRACF